MFVFSNPQQSTEDLEKTTWLPMLTQLQGDLESPQPDPNMKAMINRSCEMHVRIGISFTNISTSVLEATRLTLQTVKNTIILYAVCEEEIERLHDESHSSTRNPSARSLRDPFTPPQTNHPYSHAFLAERVNAAVVLEDLDLLLSTLAVPGPPRDHRPAKIEILPREDGKPVTLEFREAGATLDAQQIRWWIRFVGGLVKLAAHLASAQFELRDPIGDGSFWQEIKTTISDRLGLGNEGLDFLHDRIVWLDAQKLADAMVGYQEEQYSDDDLDMPDLLEDEDDGFDHHPPPPPPPPAPPAAGTILPQMHNLPYRSPYN